MACTVGICFFIGGLFNAFLFGVVSAIIMNVVTNNLSFSEPTKTSNTSSHDGSVSSTESTQLNSRDHSMQLEGGHGYCPHCGKPISFGDSFCKHCGTKLKI
ncbi:zinc ribbon domain-containing protein [Lentilactobacillus sunkii]|uniref:zinc ribbon domain-containing protein n=1 Tax=Lentilactobacillus sunkii TaxID=481719 RepID=UPI0039C88048